MLLTEQNFLKHYDAGKPFWIAHQTKVVKCEPITYGEYTKEKGYQAYVMDRNKVEYFSRKHLLLESMRDVWKGKVVYSTREEAIVRMRELFLELVDHYNKHEFKNNPIKIRKAVTSKS